MKVILTGTSGYIGQEVLHQALQNPSITSLVALSRRPLSTTHPKLQTVLVDDFTSYTPAALAALSGAESCIWTLGAKRGTADMMRKIAVDYTLAAAKAFSQLGGEGAAPLRFVFTSGVLAVRDQASSVWFMSGGRKIKGQGESAILTYSQAHASALDGYVARPAAVTGKHGGLANVAAIAAVPSIRVDVLAAAMLELALRGGGERKTWENADLARLGRERLREGKVGAA